MAEGNPKRIILLDGPKGAGKTTVADLLCQHLEKTAVLSADRERRALDNQERTRAELFKEAFAKILEKSEAHLRAGRDVIIDCGLTDERVAALEDLAQAADAQVHRFLLNASYETLLNRVRARDSARGKETDEERFDEVYKIVHAKNFHEFEILETGTSTPAEIAEKITRWLK